MGTLVFGLKVFSAACFLAVGILGIYQMIVMVDECKEIDRKEGRR